MYKGLHLIIYAILVAVALSACNSEKPDNIEPRMQTLPATDVGRTEATISGKCYVVKNTDLPQLWFCYGNSEDMTFRTDMLMDNDGNVSTRLAGLTPGTTYYYMLQGSNGAGILSGDRLSFATQPNATPSVGRAQVLSSSPVSVIVGYNIADDGGDDILESGCYVTAVDDASGESRVLQTDRADANGLFRLRIGELQPGHTYRITPFAQNRNGESVGESIEFSTTSAVVLGEAGMLQSLVADDAYSYTTISLAGPLNGDDLRMLRLMAGRDAEDNATKGKLVDIDIAGARIVAGGGAYMESRFATDNVVGTGLFQSCTGLLRVVLPSEAVSIEKDALKDCSALRSIEIPAVVTNIMPSSGCASLEAISVSAANTHFVGRDGVLLSEDLKNIVWFPMGKRGEYTLPASIETIGDYAFSGCSIERFVFGDGLKKIGRCAFHNSKVQEVALPSTLQTVLDGTFQKCLNLKTVTLGGKTELLGDYVFDGCPLTDLYVYASMPPVCTENTFATSGPDFTKTCRVHVPKGRKKYYRANAQWNVFKNIVEDL